MHISRVAFLLGLVVASLALTMAQDGAMPDAAGLPDAASAMPGGDGAPGPDAAGAPVPPSPAAAAAGGAPKAPGAAGGKPGANKIPTSADIDALAAEAGLSSAGPSGKSDPLNLGSLPGVGGNPGSLPPFSALDSDSLVSPPIDVQPRSSLALNIDKRIREVDNMLNRMVWQLNRETAWANSVHDIIQNYQYKYSKVLANIKKHTEATKKFREMSSNLKKARLHELLEEDLAKATKALNELATSSSATSEDEGSYAALKDRVSLLKQDLDKMSQNKVHKVLHGVNEKLKEAENQAVPPASADTLKDIVSAK